MKKKRKILLRKLLNLLSYKKVKIYEKENATSLIVVLTYQTESTSSGGSPINNKKYGGTTLKTETITVNSNYLQILFRTDSGGNNYYGFKAVITPNYD